MRLLLILAWLVGAMRLRALDCCAALRLPVLAFAALTLAGCGGLSVGGLFSDTGPSRELDRPALPEMDMSAPKVALMLPLGAGGQTGSIAKAMKQAAELAMFDAGTKPGIALIVKDTGGSEDGARTAAQAAIAEGAQLFIGPLLAAEVEAVAPLAQVQNIPIIAFSSVRAVAGGGTFLMSFLPEEEVANVLRYTVSTGKRNVAALLPKTPYGEAVERALKEAALESGANIVALERYSRTPTGIQGPAGNIAQAVRDPIRSVDALLIPEGGALLRTTGEMLSAAGFSPLEVKVLGTGLWDDPATRTTPVAINGWYAGVSPDQVSHFEQRYETTYGSKPPRLASLAYDATSLAIALARQGNDFTAQQLTNREGFQGVNGLFRFRPDGRIERGLAILEVGPTGPQVVQQAPGRFSGNF